MKQREVTEMCAGFDAAIAADPLAVRCPCGLHYVPIARAQRLCFGCIEALTGLVVRA